MGEAPADKEINMTVPGHFSTRAGNADEMSMRMMHAGEDFITCNLQGRSQVRRQLMKRQHEAFTACAGERSVIRETVGVALAQPGNFFTSSPTRRHVPCPVESAVRIAVRKASCLYGLART